MTDDEFEDLLAACAADERARGQLGLEAEAELEQVYREALAAGLVTEEQTEAGS